jgi:hypothetical protein
MLHMYCHMQLNVMCNLFYATTQICSCMCRMQLNFSCKRQLQNPKFLVVWAIITLGPTIPNTIVIAIHTPPQFIILELGSRDQGSNVHNQALDNEL